MKFSVVARHILVGFNTLILVLALGLITLCSTVIRNSTDQNGENTIEDYSVFLEVLLVTGFVMALIALFGIGATAYRNTFLLFTYSLFLGIFVILDIIIAVYALTGERNYNKIRQNVVNYLENIFSQYSKNVETQKWIDNLQNKWKCCGPEDANYWQNSSMPQPPASCCVNAPCTFSDVHKEGCAEALTDFVCKKLQLIGIFAIVLVILDIIMLVILFGYIKSIKTNPLINEEDEEEI